MPRRLCADCRARRPARRTIASVWRPSSLQVILQSGYPAGGRPAAGQRSSASRPAAGRHSSACRPAQFCMLARAVMHAGRQPAGLYTYSSEPLGPKELNELTELTELTEPSELNAGVLTRARASRVPAGAAPPCAPYGRRASVGESIYACQASKFACRGLEPDCVHSRRSESGTARCCNCHVERTP